MANRVVIHPGFIELIYRGDQTEETIRSMVVDALQKAKGEWGNDPFVVLANLNSVGRSTLGSRRASVTFLKTLPIGKIVVCAQNEFIRRVASLVLRAARLSSKVQVFSTRNAALDWLLGSSQVQSSSVNKKILSNEKTEKRFD